ncbi:GNAT family N-acetyltransferase [Francisella sp. Scap27]|uniref:bifunctional GNAT family N-acetyltransferase/carbon-nitrogen hydrolase family protein n=1 Tax=Francisella sp. Scap27 TaxID=2589986 RepID=UPI0015B8192F|nr:bifunctional GNAT family N-acetyltransferase/carbon-nitrogen hydrolase family protein [Francisella sp. Scap27]QLE79267.1 GNAT family N-acetyltransferase [Francisella sp. Scap27]
MQNIENISLDYLSMDDYQELKAAMIEVYNIEDPYWERSEISSLIKKFPEGQAVIKVNDQIAGCAFSIIVDYKKFGDKHTYKKITGNNTFKTHTEDGDVLYGIDLFIKPEFRGMRLGRRLYDYRKDLCERLNLKSIIFGGRIPNYHNHADEMSPKEYISRLKRQEIHDPVLRFQLSNDFQPIKIIKSYLEDDSESNDYAVLLKWTNIYYEEEHTEIPTIIKKDIRLGLIQWQMRPYKSLDELMHHAEYFVKAVSNYRSDFALFPEFFNAPLMAENNHLSEPDAIRELAKHTQTITDKFSELAITYNINIITGSMPEIKDERLYNVGYLCRRDGTTEKYEKLHVTPDEAMVWGLQGGSKLEVFDTDCGKIGILICYDSEFPELSRILAEDGMDILFVPFLTDTQNGFSRVRNCAQARAIENECYVAIAGSVGNLPNVHNMDIQYAQSMVFTPCDFAFPATGIKAETTPNTEMILIADVDIHLLRELNQFGSVKNLRDRRKDLYDLKRKN